MNFTAFNLGMLRMWLPPKLLLIMKLIIIIMTTCLLQVSAATFAQKFTYAKKDATYGLVFKEIIKQTGYKILYSDQILDKTKTINVDFKGAELKEVMETLLKNQPLSYEIDETTILIKEKEPTFLDRLAKRWASIDASGRVVDSENRPLPGASVKVKKTGKGVSTDANGKFFLRGVEEGAVLVVSFIGYLPKEVSASANMGNVVLEQSLSKLDEVQVIAYGTTTQRLSTGNVTTIKADVIEKQPVNNPLLALQGRVPGLFIEQATGFAGTGVKVRIQGQNSMNYGSDPLYVIDGNSYPSQLLGGANPILGNSGNTFGSGSFSGNPLNFINPSDIESIDVLKDADATSIYGSRAANGAILITTKKGRSGDTKIDLNMQTGWGKVTRKLDVMNSEEYLEMRNEALRNDGITQPMPGATGDRDLNGLWDSKHSTNWQKELIGGTAGYQDMNASISGGNERTSYLIGAGYHRESNVFPGDFSDKKGSVHFNINNVSANQKFRIQLSGNYLIDDNQMPSIDLTTKALTLAPVAPALYTSDGRINWAPNAQGRTTFSANPIGYLYNSFDDKTHNLISNLNLSYQLAPGLDLKSSLSYSNLKSDRVNKSLLESVQPENVQYFSRSTTFGQSSADSWIVEPQLTYDKYIGKGRFALLLGVTLQQNENRGTEVAASGFSNDLVMDDILSSTSVFPVSSLSSTYKYNAFFGRVNYNLRDKYILNLTGRRDGSSRFGTERKFHNFAAIGTAWVFSNEKFVAEHLKFLSFGKLRASYGITGSDQIGDYKFISLYNPVAQSIPYQGLTAYEASALVNPYLEWEETSKTQIGLDLGWLNDRILLNSNFYINQSSNQLAQYTLPSTTGFNSIIRNQPYKIRNKGWELALNTKNISRTDFSWITNINFSVPKTVLVDYPDIVKSSAASTAIVGLPLTALRVYHFLGVDPATGIYQFADKNGNPTSTPNYDEDAKVIIDQAPKYYGGFHNSLTFKGVQLDFMFSFVKQIAKNYSFGYGTPGRFNSGNYNQPSSLLQRWQKPGDIAPIQKFTSGTGLNQYLNYAYQSDAAWSDASYIRLKNVSLSWQLPKRWVNKANLLNFSLFLQGQNLWTITHYTGLDPETKSTSSLPPLRVITLGIKASL